jgi:hypothetical protein
LPTRRLLVLAEREGNRHRAVDLDARRPELIGHLHGGEWDGPHRIVMGGYGLRLCFGTDEAARDCH